MKYKESLSSFCASVLAFLLGYGCATCIATGLTLPVNMLFLAIYCAIGALFIGSCLSVRHGTLVIGSLSIVLLLLLAVNKQFWQQLRAMCFSAASLFNRTYNTPIPQWVNGQTANNFMLPLLLIGGLVMIITAWTVTHRKGVFFAVMAALLPIASCILIPDAQPELLPLLLLITGILLLVLTQSTRQQDEYKGSLLTAVLFVPVGAALIGLMLLIPPGTRGPAAIYSSVDTLFGWFGQCVPGTEQPRPDRPGVSIDSNSKDAISLSQLGTRLEKDTPVMEITTNFSGTMYLRSQDYDVYGGLSWQSTANRSEDDFGLLPIWRSSPEFVHIQVASAQAQYYLPVYPTMNPVLTGGRIQNQGQSTKYTYSFSPLRSDWKDFWYQCNQGTIIAPEIPTADTRYLALPEDTKVRAQALLSSLNLQKDATAVDVAEIIGEYVAGSARYSNVPSQMPQNQTDFSMWFLEEGEAGYCVHFASAATVLLRAAGIPARYVEGYVIQTQHSQKNVVQERMAHAWVEYHLDYIGWVIMDPTPSVSYFPPNSTDPTDKPTIPTVPQETTDSTEPPHITTNPTESPITSPSEIPPSATVPSPTEPSDGSNETKPADSSAGNTDFNEHTSSERIAVLVRSILVTIAVMLAIIGQWLLRRCLTSMWLHWGQPNAQALKHYRYIKYVTRLCCVDIPGELLSLTEKAAYSQYQLSIDELKSFESFIQKCVQTIQKKPWHQRMIYRFVFAVY